MMPSERRLLINVITLHKLVVERVQVSQRVSVERLVRRVVELTAWLEEVLINEELGQVGLARELFVKLDAERGLWISGVVRSFVKHYNI